MKKMLFFTLILMLALGACVSNKAFKEHQSKVQTMQALQDKQQAEIEMANKDISDARKKIDELIIRLNEVDQELLVLTPMQMQIDDIASDFLALQEDLDLRISILDSEVKQGLDEFSMDMEDTFDILTDHLRELKVSSQNFATKDELAEVINESARIARILSDLTGEVQVATERFMESDSTFTMDIREDMELKRLSLIDIQERVELMESEVASIRDAAGRDQTLKSDLENLRRRVDNMNTELNTLTGDLQNVIQKERSVARAKLDEEMKTQYQAALNQYYKRNHEQSIRMFEDFLATYANSELVPNAHYWIGENYYAAANFTKAIRTFQNVVSLFPHHHKGPDAQLKVGMSYYNMKDYAAARQELNLLKTQYPNYVHMNLVDKYLRLSN